MHKSQVFRYILLSFLGGIALGSLWTVSSEWLLGLVALATLVLGLSAYHRTFGNDVRGIHRRKIGFMVGVGVLVVTAGAWRYNLRATEESILAQFTDLVVGGKNVSFTFRGYLDAPVRMTARGEQFTFRVKEIIVPSRTILVDERILVQAPDVPGYRVGDVLVAKGALQRPKNSPDFDYVAYLKKEGIRVIMTKSEIVMDANPLTLSFAERSVIRGYRLIFGLHDRFVAAIERTIPAPQAAYVLGVLLGDQAHLPESYRTAFRDAGLSHVLAVSGFNITILGEAVLAACIWFVRRRAAFWISLAVIVAFVIMTGATASVVRAAIMGSLFMFASGYGRLYDARNSVLLAAAVMAWFSPMVLVFDLGFQLSFLAVLGLLYIYPVFQSTTARWPTLGGLTDLARMTLAAQIATLPLLMSVFGSLSLVALPANLLVVPLVPYLMLFGALAGGMGMLWTLAGKVIGIVAWGLGAYQTGAALLFASLPGAKLVVSFPWYAAVLAYLIGAFILVAWNFKERSSS
jgi:competence protein ComEC